MTLPELLLPGIFAAVIAMQAYRVFNENNALVEVTERQLDEAAAGHDALPTQLANAAGVARRRDLIGRLRTTLCVPERRNKLAAARALLALDDREAIGLLRERAEADVDAIVARVFRALALRLEGVDAVRRAFTAGDEDPALAGVLASIYTGQFSLTPEDVTLLLNLIEAYVSNKQSWISAMRRDEWRSDLYILVNALARGVALIGNREHARTILSQIVASRADRDTKTEAKKLLAQV